MTDWKRDESISIDDDPEGRIEVREESYLNSLGEPVQSLVNLEPITRCTWRLDGEEFDSCYSFEPCRLTIVDRATALLRKRMFNEQYERLKRIEAMLERSCPSTDLVSLDAFNRSREDALLVNKKYPRPNGIACPECNRELVDVSEEIYTCNPAKKSVDCPWCSWSGYRLV